MEVLTAVLAFGFLNRSINFSMPRKHTAPSRRGHHHVDARYQSLVGVIPSPGEERECPHVELQRLGSRSRIRVRVMRRLRLPWIRLRTTTPSIISTCQPSLSRPRSDAHDPGGIIPHEASYCTFSPLPLCRIFPRSSLSNISSVV